MDKDRVAIKRILFRDWFDPHDVDHLAAFLYLTNTGVWPEGFIPDNVHMEHLWVAEITGEMAAEYAKLGVAGKIIGMPAANS